MWHSDAAKNTPAAIARRRSDADRRLIENALDSALTRGRAPALAMMEERAARALLDVPAICPRCNGAGRRAFPTGYIGPCGFCGGEGVTRRPDQ